MKIITVPQAATQRGCSQQYIRQLLAADRIIGAHKLGRMWIIPIDFVVLDLPRKPSRARSPCATKKS